MKAKRELVKRTRHGDVGLNLLKVDYGNTS